MGKTKRKEKAKPSTWQLCPEHFVILPLPLSHFLVWEKPLFHWAVGFHEMKRCHNSCLPHVDVAPRIV
jgi:hypothetical protein